MCDVMCIRHCKHHKSGRKKNKYEEEQQALSEKEAEIFLNK